jgi:hypothetical protein
MLSLIKHILLLPVLIAVVSATTTSFFEEYNFGNSAPLQQESSATTATKSRLTPMKSLFADYLRKHSAEAVESWPRDALCSAQFITSHFFCRDAGNNIGTWLDNLAWAIIFNKTIIAHWKGRHSLCHGAVHLQPWVLTTSKLYQLQQQAGCVKPIVDIRLHGPQRAVGCCNVENYTGTYFNPGRVYKQAFQKLRPEKGIVNMFDGAARARAQILFSNPSRMSSYESYGLLTLLSLRFTPLVTNLTVPLLSPSIGPVFGAVASPSGMVPLLNHREVIIGVHARHQKRDKEYEGSIDLGFQRCLRHYLRQIVVISPTQNRTCSLLIASDRIGTIKLFKSTAMEFGCTPKLVQRAMKETKREHRGEHGPWGESVTSMADFYLLSHSDYFIGTKVSSFSAIMLNVVAARAALVGRTDTFAWGIHVEKLLKKPVLAGGETEAGSGLGLPMGGDDPLPCTAYEDVGDPGYLQNLHKCREERITFDELSTCIHTFSNTSFSLLK